MTDAEKIMCLEQENLKLKKDNEMLMNIITQMKVTLDRLVNRYLVGKKMDHIA